MTVWTTIPVSNLLTSNKAMNIKPIILYTLPLLLAACSSEGGAGDVAPVLDTSAPVALQQGIMALQTRAAINLNESYVAAGEDILVKMTDSETLTTTDYVYTAGESGAMTIKEGTPAAYYPNEGTVSLAAWYPATVTETFEVLADQTADADYMASDLMFAAATGDKTVELVNLLFQHKMVKLNVRVTLGADISGITAIVLKNIQRGVTVDLLTGAVTTLPISAEHPAGDINLTNDGAVLFPAQTIDGELLEIVTPEGSAYYVVHGKVFQSGRQYTLTTTLNRTALGLYNVIRDWGTPSEEYTDPNETLIF